MKIRLLLDKKIIAVWLVYISLLLLSTGSYAAKELHFFNLKIKGIGITLDMAQDHQGFIWMATNSGLFRYDGYQYRHFKHQRNDSTSLPNDKVMSLLVDGQHRLWVATAAGLALSHYDGLTGIPNRMLPQGRLRLALAASARSGRKGALLFIDMDNFKVLNDTLGHDMGDLLLQQVALRLESCM